MGWSLPSWKDNLGFYSTLAACVTVLGGTTFYLTRSKKQLVSNEYDQFQAVDYAEVLLACQSLAQQR